MSLTVGTVIEMTRDAPYKEYGVCKGDIGIINYVAKTGKYSIHIYGKSNPHEDSLVCNRKYGKPGDCWIPFDYVKEVEMEELAMKLSGFNKVAVIEICERDYHFALYDDNIVVGDTVLVSGRMAAELLTVKAIITADEAREKFKGDIIAEVKCKVDLSAYEQRVKNREEAEKLRNKMDEEIKKMDELHKYEMYALSNPALKEMLDKFKSLGV